jgi:hypothetical protein
MGQSAMRAKSFVDEESEEEKEDDVVFECKEYKIVDRHGKKVKINFCQSCGATYIDGYSCGCWNKSWREKKMNLESMKASRKQFYR